MDELEPLATALRNELGAPPDAWQQAQRARLRVVLRDQPARRSALVRVAAPMFAAFALLAALLWVVGRGSSSHEVERWLVAEELRKVTHAGQLATGDVASFLHSGD